MFQSDDFLSIDFSSSALKVARAQTSGSSLQVDFADQEEVRNLSDDNRVEKYTEALKSIKSRNSFSGGQKVMFSLPTSGVIVRHLELPAMTDERLSDVIQYEAESHIPFPLEEVVMDYHVLEKTEEETRLVLVVSKEDKLNQYLEVVQNANLRPEIIDISAFSLFNLYQYFDGGNGSENGTPPKVLVDVGHQSTDIIIFKDATLYYARSASVAGESITKEISEQLNVDEDRAEALKIEHGNLPLTNTEGADETDSSPEPSPPSPPTGDDSSDTDTPAPPSPPTEDDSEAEEESSAAPPPPEPETGSDSDDDEESLDLGMEYGGDEDAGDEEDLSLGESQSPSSDTEAEGSGTDTTDQTDEENVSEQEPDDSLDLSLGDDVDEDQGPPSPPTEEQSDDTDTPAPPSSPTEDGSEAEEESSSAPPPPEPESDSDTGDDEDSLDLGSEPDQQSDDSEDLSLDEPQKPSSGSETDQGDNQGLAGQDDSSGETGEDDSLDLNLGDESDSDGSDSLTGESDDETTLNDSSSHLESESEEDAPSDPDDESSMFAEGSEDESDQTGSDQSLDLDLEDDDSVDEETGSLSGSGEDRPQDEPEDSEPTKPDPPGTAGETDTTTESTEGSKSGTSESADTESEDGQDDEEDLDLGLGELRSPDEEDDQSPGDSENDADDDDNDDPEDLSLGAAANPDSSPAPTADFDQEALRDAITGEVDRLIGEIQQTFDYFQNEMDGEDVEEVILCGNGSKLRNLPEYIEENLTRETRRYNPSEKLVGLAEDDIQSMMVASGLHLRSDASTSGIRINLLPEEIVEERQAQKQRQKVIANGALAGVFLLQIILWVFYSYSVRQSYYQQSQDQLETVRPIVERVENLKNTREQLKNRIQMINDLQRNQTRLLPMLFNLNELEEPLRNRTWFDSISYNEGDPNGTLQIQGVTGDYQDVGDIYGWLDEMEFTLEQQSENQTTTTITIDGESRSMVRFTVNYEVTFEPYNKVSQGEDA
jgi:type IV pilus assembly protein PilM